MYWNVTVSDMPVMKAGSWSSFSVTTSKTVFNEKANPRLILPIDQVALKSGSSFDNWEYVFKKIAKTEFQTKIYLFDAGSVFFSGFFSGYYYVFELWALCVFPLHPNWPMPTFVPSNKKKRRCRKGKMV